MTMQTTIASPSFTNRQMWLGIASSLCLLLSLSLLSPMSQANELISGVVMPKQQAKLTFESNGVLTQRVKLGEKVYQGDVLAQLDSRKEKAALAKAQADLEIARTEMKKAKRNLSNMHRLHRTKSVSDNDLFDAQITLSSSQAGIERAQALLESARINLELKTLRAPFTGVVTDTKLQAGEYIEAGDETLTLSNIDQLQLSVDISLEMSRGLTENTETIIHDNGQDVGIIRVDTILPVLDPASGLRRVVWQVTPLHSKEVLAGRYVQLKTWAIKPPVKGQSKE
ncbi:efflux RND transporter periplasmic adaptor subunit [Oceanospirillum beijerinckii]|uniref:efflux RND transporter periplasmic adaptor subunit n=1 Tax=Oceanospirillum beijerinckii TaxID=64976 RepID=UPI000A060844|nr:efflux RND transporter periplasmic adaptor subunit [Oceanospirillum beijerinckii]